jgi:hypothetical protein
MLTLLERSIATIDHRLVLLAPPQAAVHSHFENVDVNPALHAEFVQEMQRLRGGIYVEDGALDRSQLTRDGLHRTPEDERSWHLLMLNRRREVTACVWYLEHENPRLDQLRVRNCPLGRLDQWRSLFRRAVESELAEARREHLRYAEVGGWAVSEESRCTSEGLVLALAGYSLGRLAGGTLGLTTATVRHCSSTILRRLGGMHLKADGLRVPSYFDPRYKCEMELLRFDSRRPAGKFAGLIDLLGERLASVPVIAASDSVWATEAAETPYLASAQYAA